LIEALLLREWVGKWEIILHRSFSNLDNRIWLANVCIIPLGGFSNLERVRFGKVKA
jgi:hypothetical protein